MGYKLKKNLTEAMELEDAVMEDMEDAIDHGILVSNLSVRLSKELNQDEHFCKEIARAGMVHDIGKLKLGEYLYGRKHDTLRIEEMKYVRMHPTLGYEVLKEMNTYTEEVLDAIYHHHENYDGTGYPSNIKGDEIPFMSRILRTCDVFAALVSERPYRAAFDMETAVELMIDEVKNFDMRIFLAFLNMVHEDDFGTVKEYVAEINQKSMHRNKSIS